MAAEPMLITRIGNACTQQTSVFIDRSNNGAEHNQKDHVVMGGFPRVKQIDTVIGYHTPVVVFA